MSVVPAIPANLDGNDDENIRGSLKTNKHSNKMFSIGRELCFLLLIALTTYASFNSNNNTGSGPPPAPFFPKGSLVGDFYKGELSEALVRANQGDLAFIMYYAPWDAECQAARRHFETVAHRHYKQVYFAGINCWQPRGECKRALNKIHQFPKLVAYLTHETGVEYRGPLDAQYMSTFLEAVRQPLHRLHGQEDLVQLRSSYNAVVVAYLNFRGIRGDMPYRAVYETALKFLGRDVRQEVAFSVVTSFKTSLEMGVNVAPCIKLYLWNETLDYQGHFATDYLVDWVTSRLHQVTLWLSPPGVKSLTLAPYISNGPALIMFTPYNNFVMYDLLREVGLEYYNCNHIPAVTELAQNISNSVSERISRVRRSMSSCQSHPQDLQPTVHIVNNFWTNASCGQHCTPSQQCQQPHSMLIPVTSQNSDPLGAAALSLWAWREKCRSLTAPPPRLPPTPLPLAVRGLACKYNRSISLLALDSSLFAHFARGLGVEVYDRTKVVILNAQMETTHVMNDPITRESLGQFLVNFTEGKLERLQRTQPPSPTPTTSYKTGSISITELTSDTFLPVAFNDSMNVLVLYYSPYCAFCHALGPVYLSAARLLRGLPSLLFTRIDGETNDLPWQYTAPQYPSILFFPARRKAESRVFTSGIGVTVDSLIRFVVSNLPMELRLSAMIQVCHQCFPRGQMGGRRQECLAEVRREVLNAISTHLSHYRNLSLRLPPSKQRRKALHQELSRLQYLKQLQLSLSVSPHRVAAFTEQSPTSQYIAVRDEL